jgi:TRAP-type transport system periplasmic protein
MLKTLLAGAAATALIVGLGASASAQIQNRNIRVSNGVNQDHPNGKGLEVMAKCVADKSDGKIKITGFWGGALGGDLQATQALRSGTQEMVVTSTSPLVGIVPEVGVFDLPFLISSEKEADALLDGEFGKYISDKLPEKGLVNLAYWENGFRNTTNSKQPITKWEDFKGVKMRVMQNPIFLDTFKNMGANAVPMNFGEVFAALETRTIDGQENPFVTIETSKFNEVQKFLSVTNHAYTPFMVLISKRIWDTYSPEEQKILRDCAVEARAIQRQTNRELNAKSLESVKAKGMQVNTLSEQETARMREQAKPIYEKHAATIGKETVDKAMAELEKIRSAAK